MICNTCHHTLPSDSTFCQYCGKKLEKTETVAKNIEETADDQVRAELLETQANETVRAMEANRQNQPDHENEDDFGLVPHKPVFTLATMSVTGEREYLENLRTVNGEKIRYNRRGSVSISSINGMIDVYDTFLPSGQPYKTIYINMYGAEKSTKAPVGFVLFGGIAPSAKMPQKESSKKIRYCSRCGAVIDSDTKVCTGCGKQYFKGIHLDMLSCLALLMAMIIVGITSLYVIQYMQMTELEEQFQSTEQQLNAEITNLQADLREQKVFSDFIDRHVVFVDADGDKDIYHKVDCLLFQGQQFWAFNLDAAIQKGYMACPLCH